MSVNSRDACGDVDEHLLWKVSEGSRRRHRSPGDEEGEGGFGRGGRRQWRWKEVGKRASAQWQMDERTGFGVVPLCSNQREARTVTLGTAVVSCRPTNCTVTALRTGASFEFGGDVLCSQWLDR